MKYKWIIPIGVILLLVLIVISWANGVYNKTLTLQESVDARWADVQATYQRRLDPIPNLVATVKGSADLEKSILINVTEARAGISRSKTPGEIEMFGKQINSAINLAFEAYPQIRSTQNFSELQAQLEGTENRINNARMKYNESVKDYNRHIRGVFKRMAIKMMGDLDEFPRKEGFEATAEAQSAPKVEFNYDNK